MPRFASPTSPVCLALAIAALVVSSTVAQEAIRPKVVLTDQARELHRSCLVVDGHNDLPYKLRDKAGGDLSKLDVSQPQPRLHTDLARLAAGGVGAQFWAAYVPTEHIRQRSSARFCLEQIDLIQRVAAKYPDRLEMAYTAADIERIAKAGKIASLIGIEGGHAIEESLPLLRMFYRLGARYMTLTHSETLSWADASTDDARNSGLTPFGQAVVLEMNRLGMLVDLSHVSPDTMRQAIRLSQAPVIFSHSSAYALAPHPRNVPDDVLQMVAKNQGLVMVNFYSGFLVPEGARRNERVVAVKKELKAKLGDGQAYDQALDQWYADNPIPSGSVHTVVDHIEHIIKLAGVDHVGLGSDYDGVTQLPTQLEDVSTYPLITQELLNRGRSPAEIKKILGANFLRVFRAGEETARRLTQGE